MISTGLLVLLGLVVWVLAYGPPDPAPEAEHASEPAFGELAALFDAPPIPPDRTTHPR